MRMPRALVVALVFSQACGGGGGGKKAESVAGCGVHEKNGVQTRTFCGKATATLTMGDESVTFPGGECETTATYVSVNIGTVVLGTGAAATALKAATAYFGMNIGRTPGDDAAKAAADKDGSYPISFAANDHGRAVTVVSGTATLTDNRTKGTMSGTALDQRPVTGRFSCS